MFSGDSVASDDVSRQDVSGDDVRHDAVIELRSGDFDFPDLQPVADDIHALFQAGKLPDRKDDDDKSADGVHARHFPGDSVSEGDDRLFRRGRGGTSFLRVIASPSLAARKRHNRENQGQAEDPKAHDGQVNGRCQRGEQKYPGLRQATRWPRCDRLLHPTGIVDRDNLDTRCGCG